MINSEQLQNIKQIPITEYLASKGLTPVQTIGGQLFYCSPKTNEKSASLAVQPDKNVFYDWSGEGKGDIISLVRHLEGCSFSEAIHILQCQQSTLKTPSFSFSGHSIQVGQTSIEIFDIKPLTHIALKEYVQKRGISLGIAYRYLREIHYLANGKKYFALAFPNDTGGYEVRNAHFKGSFSPKDISSFIIEESNTLLIFEGFFDYLSALEYYSKLTFPTNVIVLNSLTQLNKILPNVAKYSKVNLFLDNDEAGKRAIGRIKSVNDSVSDFSRVYNQYKDFNEYLINR